MAKSKIMIVDDHEVVIEGLKGLLRDSDDFEIVGAAYDGRQALRSVEALRPDMVVMDITMPHLNGIDATLHIKKAYPKTGIIIYTMHAGGEYVLSLLKAGISAYVLKNDPLADLELALYAVRGKGTYFCETVREILSSHLNDPVKEVQKQDPFESLSLREREVMQLLAEGRSIKEIAGALYISPKTVETHKYHIMEKLNISRIADLVKIAIRKNLTSL